MKPMITRLTSAVFSRRPLSLSYACFSSSTKFLTAELQKTSAKQFVEDSIAENKVMIFSKSWCPHSKRVKSLFVDNFPYVNFHDVELDKRDDGVPIQQYLHEKTGQHTVPNVFVNKQHIGGNDNTTAAWKSGQLNKLIAE